jgi:hypothetical protein
MSRSPFRARILFTWERKPLARPVISSGTLHRSRRGDRDRGVTDVLDEYTRLTLRRRRAYPPPTSRRMGDERDEYPSGVGREIRWLVETGATTAANGPGSLRTERRAMRRRGADPVDSGAERQRYRAAPIGRDRASGHRPSVTKVRLRRMRVAPRKARPFVPGRDGRFLIPGPDVTGPRATRPDRPHEGRTR